MIMLKTKQTCQIAQTLEVAVDERKEYTGQLNNTKRPWKLQESIKIQQNYSHGYENQHYNGVQGCTPCSDSATWNLGHYAQN